MNLFILCIYFFGCTGSSLLCTGFLQLRLAGATLGCGVRASHCGGLSCCGAWALGTWASVVAAHGLYNAGSVVVAHGPSRSTACGILPDQGSNLCPLHWQADSQPLRHQGSPILFYFEDIFIVSQGKYILQISIVVKNMSAGLRSWLHILALPFYTVD